MIDVDVDDDGGRVGLEGFLDGRVDVWFRDHGFLRPVRSWSGGGGVHLLVAYPEMLVSEVPDVGERLRCFRDELVGEFSTELAGLGARIDPSTYDLGRRVKVFGANKPGGKCSRFDAVDRVEDVAFREYLLGLEVIEAPGGVVAAAVPEWFSQLLSRDPVLRAYWQGKGKRRGDLSRSGFDFSITKRLFELGYTDFDAVGKIIAARPGGVVQRRGKGVQYVRRTLANAVLSHEFRKET